jgi:hypothetical protein
MGVSAKAVLHVFMGGPTIAFLSLWMDLRKLSSLYVSLYVDFLSLRVDLIKLSCLYGWTCENFPVCICGPAKAYLSLFVDLRKLSCLYG